MRSSGETSGTTVPSAWLRGAPAAFNGPFKNARAAPLIFFSPPRKQTLTRRRTRPSPPADGALGLPSGLPRLRGADRQEALLEVPVPVRGGLGFLPPIHQCPIEGVPARPLEARLGLAVDRDAWTSRRPKDAGVHGSERFTSTPYLRPATRAKELSATLTGERVLSPLEANEALFCHRLVASNRRRDKILRGESKIFAGQEHELRMASSMRRVSARGSSSSEPSAASM